MLMPAQGHPAEALLTCMSITLLLGSYLDWNFSGCITTNFPGDTFRNLAISVLKVW